MKRTIIAILVMLAWAMPARAATVVIDPTLTQFTFGSCAGSLCTGFNSPIYNLPGGTFVMFGEANFLGTFDFRSGPCSSEVHNCSGLFGSAYARFSFFDNDLPTLTDDDNPPFYFQDCEPGPNPFQPVCPLTIVPLNFLLPTNAIGIQLVIGAGRFVITPAVAAATVPLPAGLPLLASALAFIGLMYRRSKRQA